MINFYSIIDENTKYKIQLELDKMQEEYSAQLDEKLNRAPLPAP